MVAVSHLILGCLGLSIATSSIVALSIVYAPSPVIWAQPIVATARSIETCRYFLYAFLTILGIFGGSVAARIRSSRSVTARTSVALTIFAVHCIFALFALLLDAYIEIKASRDHRRSLPEDLKFAMYQYMVEDAARSSVDDLHIRMNCCGINNVTDWTTVTTGASLMDNPLEASRSYVPRSCCAHEKHGRCTRFRTVGCYDALMYAIQVRLPAVFYPNVILASVLYMLALAARAVQRM